VSTDRETTRIVRSWLEDGVTQLPDTVLDAVLDNLPSTHQRRVTWWPARRLPRMNNPMRLALGGLAIVVAAVLGVTLLTNNVGDPSPTPIQTPIQTPAAQQLPTIGDIDAGTYRVGEGPDVSPRSFTVTVPDGWSSEQDFVTKGDDESVAGRDVFVGSWVLSHVFEDACLRPAGNVPEGLIEARTAEQLVDALASQGGHETTGPTDASVGGYPAQRLEFFVPEDFDVAACDSDFVRLWPGPGPDMSRGQPMVPGQTMSIHIVDVDGEVAVVIAASLASASATDVAEMEAVLASIQFAEQEGP
jgi:hypothetical protein